MNILNDMPPRVLESILEAGILAPSADNHHLFRFSVREDHILMMPSDAYRVANAQTRLLGWISYGTVLENMQLQAGALGWSLRPTWFPGDDVLCEVGVGQLASTPDPLVGAIPLRHTNRRFFSGPALQPEQQADLEHQLSETPGVTVVWLDAPDLRRRALRLIRLAESERFRSQSLHAELFAPLRFDVGYKASCKEGIPIDAAEIEPPARPLFRLMRHWRVMRLLNFVGGYWLVGWRAAYFPARLSPHLALLVGHGDLRTAAIQTGRGFERLWLRATQMGLALQPFAAAALFALSEFQGVSAEVRGELRKGWGTVASDGTPLMVFRLGHAAAPSVRTGRPPLSCFLQTS